MTWNWRDAEKQIARDRHEAQRRKDALREGTIRDALLYRQALAEAGMREMTPDQQRETERLLVELERDSGTSTGPL